eukprot:1594903-Amphidinium_carterae.1
MSQQGLDAISIAQAGGLVNISADLMTGLPGQSEDDVRHAIHGITSQGSALKERLTGTQLELK